MSIPLATTELLVVAPGAPTLDAQRRRVPGAPAEPRGPYRAHVSLVSAFQLPEEERRDAQLRNVTVQLDPEAWPVVPGAVLVEPDGTRYDVRGAAQRGGVTGRLAHVQVDARRVDVGA